jgi:uncharacterized membrane protein YdjX (TVP38/TMEM64 family)
MEILILGNEFVAGFIFFIICFLQPIFLPLPEAATVTACSAVFGSLVAACISFTGTLLGILTAYLLAKVGGQKLILRFVKERHLDQYQQFASRNETLILLILFIIPILPDEIICFGAGIARVSFKKFVFIAGIAKFITSFSLSYSVDYAQSLNLTNSEFIILVIGIVAIVMFTATLSKKLFLKRKNTL